jgi:hypothetical protein
MNRLLIAFIPLILVAGTNPKSAVATRTPKPPKIDAVLDEPEWKLAKVVSDFHQLDPIEGAQPSERTEIRFLYDDDALYIGCTMFDSEPAGIVSRLSRRDDEVESDRISIRLDSYHDHQTNYEFTINAAGVKVDILQYDDGVREDESWDGVWDLETRITTEGWIAEVKIPFKMLRFRQQASQEWGLQIIRRISRKQERIHWALIGKSESGWTSKFGHLVGLENISTSSNIELLPYAVGGNRFVPPSKSHPDGTDPTFNLGADVKYKPSAALTVDATFNPDFGQVEADPSTLNLSTFETFYPEKRPFFVEGAQIFRFTTFGDGFGPGLFYSRRIGRSLSVSAPVNGYVLDQPRFATILGAAKISGKTENGLSIGVLEAMTRAETATLVDSLGATSSTTVEPLTNYALVRLKKDFWANSNAGLIVTTVNREGRIPALTVGSDWNLRFSDNTYRLDGFLAGSRSQTPGTLWEGSAGRVNLGKEAGEHWRWSLGLDFTTPKYFVNDMGFYRRPNDWGSFDQLQYRVDQPGEYLRQWNVSALYHWRDNFDGVQLFRQTGVSASALLLNYWSASISANYDVGGYDDRETRGNGLYRRPGNSSVAVNASSDSRRAVVGSASFQSALDQRGSAASTIGSEFEFKPLSNLTFSLGASYTQRTGERAWVANVLDSVSNSTTSIFADRSTRTWNLASRGSYVFTHDLTFQWYFQVFFAQGTYASFVRLVDPETTVGTTSSKPEFNNPEFHLNVVLRWEFLPGSTAYLVWSQARQGNIGSYTTSFGENFSNTFGLPTENVLLLKVSYWLSY